MGNHDTGSTAIKGVTDFSRRIVRDSDEARSVGGTKSGNAEVKFQTPERSVLRVDAENVQARVCEYFGNNG